MILNAVQISVISILVVLTIFQYCYTWTNVPKLVENNFNQVNIGDSLSVVSRKIGLPAQEWHKSQVDKDAILEKIEKGLYPRPERYYCYYSSPGRWAGYCIGYKVTWKFGKVESTSKEWFDP